MGAKTKIDWADATWNPVTGCLHGCEYCYARRIAERFGGCDAGSTYGAYHQATWRRVNPDSPRGEAIFEIDAKTPPINLRFDPVKQVVHTTKAPYPWGFQPTLHRDLLEVPQRWKKQRTVFVCSMADLFGEWVPDEWIQAVFKACEKAPQHRYLFLTKNPGRYPRAALDNILVTGDRFWYGTSTPRANDPAFWSRPSQASGGRYYHTFLSVEPILERFGKGSARGSVALTDWVIVGAETGNRKDKVIPERGWILELAEECDKRNKPIFMKDSLRELMGGDFRQEFPWEA